MRVAYILSHSRLSPTNGVVSQALTWKEGLEQNGHKVTLINMWEANNWKEFDILHFFGFSQYTYEFVRAVKRINPNIVVSPILDPPVSKLAMKLYSYWGCEKLRLFNLNYCLRLAKDDIKLMLTRSNFENGYISESFGFPNSKIATVRLSYDDNKFISKEHHSVREDFCLHISLLMDERKNVRRLIEAAKKYNFNLKLGGKLRNDGEVKLLNEWINGADNVEYLGFLSTKVMLDLYSKAKVFALPSTFEGVGIVGLEAAAMGCDIVVTNVGGPKEYYSGYATNVNPFSIDDIGLAISNALNKNDSNQDLNHYVRHNYSLRKITEDLVNSYKSVI
jgi:glycosyltransferase involved in cell wall biosynthesis